MLGRSAFKATGFEHRHQTLLHLLLVGMALAAYFLDPNDIVWAVVRRHTNREFVEQATFAVGTLMLLVCAVLETWANARANPNGPYRYLPYPLLLARLLFALVLGLLVPLAGTILLMGGEALLVSRLIVRDRGGQPRLPVQGRDADWGEALRWTAAKWGLVASMIVFPWTLQDRIAEIGAGASFLLWLALNRSRLMRSQDS
jgi:hypothetical protein